MCRAPSQLVAALQCPRGDSRMRQNLHNELARVFPMPKAVELEKRSRPEQARLV